MKFIPSIAILGLLLISISCKAQVTEKSELIDIWRYKNLAVGDAIELAKTESKQIILYFTHSKGTNCKRMENNIQSSISISTTLTKDYIFVPLFVDEKSMNSDGLKSIGNINQELQIEKFKTNAQPLFVKMDEEMNIIAQLSYNLIRSDFENFLNSEVEK